MKIALILYISLVFNCIALQAQEIFYNQAFIITDNYETPGTSSKIYLPIPVYISDGRFLMYWNRKDSYGNPWGMAGRLYDLNSGKLESNFEISKDKIISGGIIHLKNDKFIVCYRGWENNEDNIYAQILNSNGDLQEPKLQVNTNSNGSQVNARIISLTDGGFVIFWSDQSMGTLGQIYNADCTKRGDQIQGNVNIKAICSLLDSGFVVCMERELFTITCQIFNNDGTKRGEEFHIGDIHQNQSKPAASNLSNGGFVICWESNDGYFDGIYAQIFDQQGNKKGQEFLVNTCTIWEQEIPRCCIYKNDGFVVSWRSEFLAQICCQLFDNDGNRRGSEFQINNIGERGLRDHTVGRLTNGGFVIRWLEGRSSVDFTVFFKCYLETNHPIIPFSLIKPENDSSINTKKIIFQWHKAHSTQLNLPHEMVYNLYLDKTSEFNEPEIFESIYDTTCTIDSLTPYTTYFWKILAKNLDGDSLWSINTNGFFVNYDTTSIEDITIDKQLDYKLYPNYPNPFNPTTEIKFFIENGGRAKLAIYNLLGQEIKLLIDSYVDEGLHSIKWDGTNNNNTSVSSGVYIYKLFYGKLTISKKMLLLK